MVKAKELTGDESSWNWKQIKAAVNGGSEIPAGDSSAYEEARGVSNPESFFRLAQSFARVQATLALCRDVTQLHSHAIAGDDRPWQGGAADAFNRSMKWTVGVLDSHIDQITAAADKDRPEQGSIIESLVAAGNRLAYSRAVLDAIDSHYASEARRLGVEPMDNGLIPVSKRPDIVAMMDRDMRAEFERLNEQYSLTVNDLRPPPPEEPPTTDPLAPPGEGPVTDPPPLPDRDPSTRPDMPADWIPNGASPDSFPTTERPGGLSDSSSIGSPEPVSGTGLEGPFVRPFDSPNGADPLLDEPATPFSEPTLGPGDTPAMDFTPATTLAGADALTSPTAFPGGTVSPASSTGIGSFPGGAGSPAAAPMSHSAPLPAVPLSTPAFNARESPAARAPKLGGVGGGAPVPFVPGGAPGSGSGGGGGSRRPRVGVGGGGAPVPFVPGGAPGSGSGGGGGSRRPRVSGVGGSTPTPFVPGGGPASGGNGGSSLRRTRPFVGGPGGIRSSSTGSAPAPGAVGKVEGTDRLRPGSGGTGVPFAGAPATTATGKEASRERKTWLVEEDDVWGADPDSPAGPIGRPGA